MSMDMLKAILYFQPTISPENGLLAIKKAFYSFDNYLESPLTIAQSDMEILEMGDVMASEDTGYRFSFKHEPMARMLGQRSWNITFRYLNDISPNTSEIRIIPMLGDLSEESNRVVFDFMLYALPRFVQAASPNLALMNGIDESEEWKDAENERSLPIADSIQVSSLPPFFTPWVYLGANLLTEQRRFWLKDLRAFKTQPLGEGWLVQSVPDLYTQPSSEFVDQLKRAPESKPIGYRQTKA